MPVPVFSTPTVSKEFSSFVTTALEELPETVTDLLSRYGYHIALGQSQSDIWKTFPRIVDAVGRKSKQQEALIKDGHYEPAMGLCLYFLDTPVITYTENTSLKRGLILTHEIGHAIDNLFKPRLSDSEAFKAAYERDKETATQTARVIERYAKRQVQEGYKPKTEEGAKAYENMHGMLKTQLEDKMGRQEIWANHFVHIIHGKPMKPYLSHNFPHTLEVVRQQLEQARIIAIVPRQQHFSPASAPQKTNG